MISFRVKKDFTTFSDDKLVSYVINGDSDAVVYFFYKKFTSTFQYHIYKLFDCKMDVSDLVDEFFLYMYEDNWRRMKMFDSSKSSLSTWISTVSYRFFKDFKRSVIDLNGLVTISNKWENFRSDWVVSVDKGIDMDIRMAINNIDNDRDKMIAKQLLLEDRDPDSVAKTFGLNSDYIYTIKNRLLKKIKSTLKSYI